MAEIREELMLSGFVIGMGAIASLPFSTVGLATGALVGAGWYCIVRPIYGYLNDNISQLAGIIAGIFASAAAAFGIAKAFGIPFTFGASMALAGTTLGITVGTVLLLLAVAELIKICKRTTPVTRSYR